MAAGFEFDWDAENTRHLKRHRITTDEFEELMEYQAQTDEERCKALGATKAGRVGRREKEKSGLHTRQPQLPKPLPGQPPMKKERLIPAFKSESEEAEWWYKKPCTIGQRSR